MPGLLSSVRTTFASIPDSVRYRTYSLSDCLMAGLALLTLKYPSLLHFDKQTRSAEADPVIAHNLKALFTVARTPCDTTLRKRLDTVDPASLRGAFHAVHRSLQRGKALAHFTVMGGHYLLAMDGTGYYSSKRIPCSSCCQKQHRDGTTTYDHQMFARAFVHPDSTIVFPLAPEMIDTQDGTTKNDCERNAAKRFITAFRKEHPHLKTIVVEDALASNGPHIKHLKDHNLRFILGAKPGDHKRLFDWGDAHPDTPSLTQTTRTKKGTTTHHDRWLHNVPLNDSNFTLEVNVLHSTEVPPNGQAKNGSWVTDLSLDKTNVTSMMRAGRARWKIENETFKTLKTDGDHFEHNFGHGHHDLDSVFVYLGMRAFLLDQVVEHSCGLFQQARHKQQRKVYLRDAMVRLFKTFLVSSWETFYRALYEPRKRLEVEAVLKDP